MSQIGEDKDAIRDLLSEYCICMDNGRFDDLGLLFAPDGTWNGIEGPAAIAERIRSIVPVAGEGPRRIHFLSNVIIKVATDTAHAASNWMVVRESDQGPIVGAAGTYVDDLVRRDDGWRFQSRISREDIAGDLGLKR
jgi:SnoaL-like domain